MFGTLGAQGFNSIAWLPISSWQKHPLYFLCVQTELIGLLFFCSGALSWGNYDHDHAALNACTAYKKRLWNDLGKYSEQNTQRPKKYKNKIRKYSTSEQNSSNPHTIFTRKKVSPNKSWPSVKGKAPFAILFFPPVIRNLDLVPLISKKPTIYYTIPHLFCHC